jgi:putative addiction module component (TIGR02574 family)
MGPQAQKLLKEALELSADERSRIATLLLDSVDRSAQDALKVSWVAKVKSRMTEGESGTVKPISWEDARKQMDHAINSRKRP